MRYGDFQGKADLFQEEGASDVERGETTDLTFQSTVETNLQVYNQEIEQYLAGFLHRGDTKTAPDMCRGRIRLTPSGPSKVGSLWYRDDVPVNNGFDTYFTFQITDHSKECTLHSDQYFTLRHHRTCSVHGGDGFAFVIQNSPNNTATVGQDGGDMGFGGIVNSLAIAFDTWQNPGDDRIGVDHISVQSLGSKTKNSGYDNGLLGIPRVHNLADGSIHLVRITYFSDLRAEYLNYLIASESLLPYLLDNGDQKRIGTLVIWIDDGVASDTPIIAMPINLSLLLDLPTDKAFVGFTASTGRFFEKHDILSWYFCNEEPCKDHERKQFDYHQSSRFYTSEKLRQSLQGPGYGGGGNEDGFPSRHTSPNTDPWTEPMQHFSTGRNIGLFQNGSVQVPPNTNY